MVKLAVIGTGGWGKNHARGFSELKMVGELDELVLCDLEETRVREQAEQYGVDWTSDPVSLATDPDLDGVCIATPTPFHFIMAREFLKAGKHVLVEKPMTQTSEEAKELVDLVETTGKHLMVGHIFRFHPAIRKLKQMLSDGELGEVLYMSSSRLAYRAPRPDMGVIHALAVHELDLFCHILDQPKPDSISASIGSWYRPGIDEHTAITMEFPGGQLAYATESWLDPTVRRRDLIVVGTKASVKVDYMVHDELSLFPASIERDPEESGDSGGDDEDGSEENLVSTQGEQTPVKFEKQEPLKEEQRHFLECVKGICSPQCDVQVGKRSVQMIEASFQSAKEGRVIQLGE